jgi:hypothetical protein
MIERLYATTLFALYQMSVALGIVMLPVALLTRRVGFTPPVDRVVRRLEAAHDATRSSVNH